MNLKIVLATAMLIIPYFVDAQNSISGKIFDGDSKEPLPGATVLIPGTTTGCLSDTEGRFNLTASDNINEIEVSFLGYERRRLPVSSDNLSIPLIPSVSNLEQIVVTASREAALRTEAPMAISKLSSGIIQETKPTVIAELINKIPGVVMLNYNNEQHAMSIRQPMGISPYFLYMEDGLPIRPMGIFNHNALIEMNVCNISAIEVVKGPASSLYGPEAVGGAINFITHRPTAVPVARVGLQADQWGYQRLQLAGGGMINEKLGFFVSGFEARQRNSWQAFSDYNKLSINTRIDYKLTPKTKLSLSFSGNEYLSDMPGAVDSISFYTRSYSSTTDFTYRKVHSQRTRLGITHQWNEFSETSVILGYRDNYIEQNPNYAIRWTAGSETASGEVNRNTFYSKIGMLQHVKRFERLRAKVIAGATIDLSPTNYWAYRTDLGAQLRPDGKSVERYTLLQEHPETFLSNYNAGLKNFAVYSQAEISPVERLKLTIGIRYDNMSFEYDNHLSHTMGNRSFRQFSPKVGVTYELNDDIGVYANYSRGFSPPGLTAIFRKKPNPDPNAPVEFYYNLEPAHFDNMEVGGWASLVRGMVYIDLAAYQMTGHKELLSIRQPDNSNDYQSAGKTLHRGIEYGLNFKPSKEWSLRLGGTNAIHRFEEFVLSIRNSDNAKDVNGKNIPQSPGWIANSEITWKPAKTDGLRVSVEWQRIGTWYEDQLNNFKYNDAGFLGLRGVSYLNFRSGYSWKRMEVFCNILNLTNELYANSATRGNAPTDRATFTPGAPRTFVIGVQYNFTGRK
jgi:iron complex outermembrane recepter protein